MLPRRSPFHAVAAKSTTLEAASEFSEPLALDMATARIAASKMPASAGRHRGRTRNPGNMESDAVPGPITAECRAKT